jgi:thioredoxin-dependent peroxiredoxin
MVIRIVIGVLIIIALLVTTVLGGNLLGINSDAPDFTLATHSGDTVHMADMLKSNIVVLIFYPGDATPGCTKQLCAIRDDYSRFAKAGAVVYGVNPGSAASHKKFAEKQGYQFPLLVDEKSVVAKKYNAKGVLMTTRTVYVIDRQGKIIFARRGMPSVDEIITSFKGDSRNREKKE